MKNYIPYINSLVNEINSLPRISEENQRKLDKKFRLEFNFNSNHIEGNTLTYSETELLLIFDKTEGIHEMREYEEMKAHDVAFKLIQEWALDKDFRLSEIHIKQLNEIILVRPFYKEAITPDGQATRRLIEIGQYKTQPNSVRLQNGEIFDYASPLETPMKMGDLMAWYHEETEKKELHSVALAALFHYKFVLIHPFDDGNGRISRLIMNYVLLKNNLPPVIIKTAEKKNYLNALNQADTGNLEAFVEFIASQLAWSLDIKKKAIKGESLDEPGDLDKKLSLFKKKVGIEEEITQYYSIETIEKLSTNLLYPLFKNLELVISKFDIFFNNRKNIIKHEPIFPIDGSTFSGNKIDELFLKIMHGEFQLLISAKIKKFEVQISYDSLRQNKKNIDLIVLTLTILLNDHTYELILNDIKINNLYSNYLSKEEIEKISEEIGNAFFNKIEKYL